MCSKDNNASSKPRNTCVPVLCAKNIAHLQSHSVSQWRRLSILGAWHRRATKYKSGFRKQSQYTKHFGEMFLPSSKPERNNHFSLLTAPNYYTYCKCMVYGAIVCVCVVILLQINGQSGSLCCLLKAFCLFLFLHLLLVVLMKFLVNNFYCSKKVPQEQDEKCQGQHKYLEGN